MNHYEDANWYKSQLNFKSAITSYLGGINDQNYKINNLNDFIKCYYELIWIYIIYTKEYNAAFEIIQLLIETFENNYEIMSISKTYKILIIKNILKKKKNSTSEIKSQIDSLTVDIKTDINDIKKNAYAGSQISQYFLSLYYKYCDEGNLINNLNYSKKFGEMAYRNNMDEAGFLLYEKNNSEKTIKYLFSAAIHKEPESIKLIIKYYDEKKKFLDANTWRTKEQKKELTDLELQNNELSYDNYIAIIYRKLIQRDFMKVINKIKLYIFLLKDENGNNVKLEYFQKVPSKSDQQLSTISQNNIQTNAEICTLSLTKELCDPFIQLVFLYLRHINIDTHKYIKDDRIILNIAQKYIDYSAKYLGNPQSKYVKLYLTVIIYKMLNTQSDEWKNDHTSELADDDFGNNTSSNIFFEYHLFKHRFLKDFIKNPIDNFHNYQHIIQTIHNLIDKFKNFNTFIELYILGKLYSYLFKFFHKNVEYFNLSKYYYRLSAEQGYKFACYKMTKIYMNTRNFYPIENGLINAQKWVERTKELGSAEDITSELAKKLEDRKGGTNYYNHISKKNYMKFSKKKNIKNYQKKSKRIIF